MKNKSYLTNFLQMLIILLAGILLGTILLLLVYCLPTGIMRENISRNLDRFYTESDYHDLGAMIGGSVLDNYTDSLMLNTAIYEDGSSVLHNAMTNPHAVYGNATSRSEELLKSVLGIDTSYRGRDNYSRYWHGYLVILKPLLLFFSPAEIRLINLWVQLGLLFFVMIGLYKAGGYRLALPYLLAVAVLNPVSTALSMQYSSCFYITLLGTLYLLHMKKTGKESLTTLFLLLGMATAFFDLLTYPLVSLGINLIICLVLSSETLKENLKRISLYSIIWFLGYGGLWAGKWMIASLLGGENVIADAMNSVLYRIAGNSAEETGVASDGLFSVLWRNTTISWSVPMQLLLVGLAIFFIVRILLKKEKCSFLLPKQNVLSVLIMALYPILWYIVLQNHSFIHFWMTYRELAITAFALAVLLSHLQWNKILNN